MNEEYWRNIPEFPNYDISNFGRVYNHKRQQVMAISFTQHKHAKITLTNHQHERHTRSVAQLVADAFVRQPNMLCDQIIVLDGDFSNVRADNLAWRPRWFAWKYTRQLKTDQPNHYKNLAVLNTMDNIVYESIVQAGMSEGLLFDDIWQSTYRRTEVFPHGIIFEIFERV